MTQATDFYTQMLESQRRAAEQRVETRAALVTELRALGVTRIAVQYEGYGDSGNVEDVVVTPDTITLTEELRRRVEDFGWDFAYALSPGFENNEGGYGELTWSLEADKIDVSHSNRYMALPHFVWRNYPETGKFRRDNCEFEAPLVARERSFGSKRRAKRFRRVDCIGQSDTKRHLPGLWIAFTPTSRLAAPAAAGLPRPWRWCYC